MAYPHVLNLKLPYNSPCYLKGQMDKHSNVESYFPLSRVLTSSPPPSFLLIASFFPVHRCTRITSTSKKTCRPSWAVNQAFFYMIYNHFRKPYAMNSVVSPNGCLLGAVCTLGVLSLVGVTWCCRQPVTWGYGSTIADV